MGSCIPNKKDEKKRIKELQKLLQIADQEKTDLKNRIETQRKKAYKSLQKQGRNSQEKKRKEQEGKIMRIQPKIKKKQVQKKQCQAEKTQFSLKMKQEVENRVALWKKELIQLKSQNQYLQDFQLQKKKMNKFFIEHCRVQNAKETLRSGVYEGKEPTEKSQTLFCLKANMMNLTPIEELHPDSSIIKEIQKKDYIVDQIIFGKDTRKKIQNTNKYPYCCIGMVTGQFGIVNYNGTGCLIAPNIVLTCAHNLYYRTTKQESKKMEFSPAVNGQYGRSFKVKKMYYPDEYKVIVDGRKAKQYDIALLELEENLVEQYGYLGIDSRNQKIKKVKEIQVCGYPGDKQKNTMWSAVGSYEEIDDAFIQYKIPTFKGQSGSPIIKSEKGKKFIIGVHAGSDERDTNNFAVMLTREKIKKLNELIGGITMKLKICQSQLIDNDMDYLTEEDWSQKLTHLELDDNKITSKGLGLLSQKNWPKMKELYLNCNLIDGEGIIFLQKFPIVERLDLCLNKIEEKGMQAFGIIDLPNLQILDLSGNDIGDESMNYLLKFNKMKKLYLRQTKLTKKGVQILSKGDFPNLSDLNLNINEISDEAIEYLSSFPKIQNLFLIKTGITQKGMQLLWQMELPLKVLHIRKNSIGQQGKSIAEKMRKERGIDVLQSKKLLI